MRSLLRDFHCFRIILEYSKIYIYLFGFLSISAAIGLERFLCNWNDYLFKTTINISTCICVGRKIKYVDGASCARGRRDDRLFLTDILDRRLSRITSRYRRGCTGACASIDVTEWYINWANADDVHQSRRADGGSESRLTELRIDFSHVVLERELWHECPPARTFAPRVFIIRIARGRENRRAAWIMNVSQQSERNPFGFRRH